MQSGIPLEDWVVGQKITTRGRTIAETDIVNYVNTVGYTESLFLDMEYLREKGHDRRMAPALLTAGIADALIIQTGILHNYAVALLGIDNLVARAPVYAGDTLRVEVEVNETKASTSRPDRGVVASHQRVINQTGEVVLEYDVKRMVLREKSV
ncbi:MAG: acyl dehydratase [Nitrospinaceae bacterium]|nr:acyl dehydratase [Nitrospinaceae bacterium]MBT3433917.1 acyl dehydratase [Nitrospinaceae bacterium]MBT3822040.1 acyl dehydratase [Nitrospinaceae bacterium]MBT4095509.1 acyl dehydratase [Nitrospinaceae bacterium]MBT4429053.1 acyl dehydratase [Nitrospinaceae bacterium]